MTKFKSAVLLHLPCIQYGKSYGSLDDTIITIEADESTPLLVDRKWTEKIDGNNAHNTNNNKNNRQDYGEDNAQLRNGSSLWSFASSDWSQGSGGSTKSFKSHFGERNVLAFVFLTLAGLSIATYLLIIESRLPSITFSLDLVHHDAWSRKPLPMGSELNPNNVDNVILIQTGSKSCDNSYQCLKVLHEMQENFNEHEELPYNFLIGCEGLVFEARGWSHESGMPDVPQSSSLVIGIMGTYEKFPPQKLLRTAQFLIKESLKRHKLQRNYTLYGLP